MSSSPTIPALQAHLDARLAELVADGPADLHARFAISEELLPVARALERTDLVADMLRRRADYYLRTSEFHEAIDAAQESVALYRSVGHTIGLGSTLATLASIELQLCRYDEAEVHTREALGIFRSEGDRPRTARALMLLGLIHGAIGEYEEATAEYGDALAIEEAEENLDGIAGTLTNMGLIALESGDYVGALGSFERSLELFRELGNRYGEAVALKNAGDALIGLEQHDEALEKERECLAIARELGERYHEAAALDGIGCALIELGRIAEARVDLERSLAIKEEIDDRQGMVETLINMGRAATREGRHDDGAAWLERALAIVTDIGARPVEARVHLAMGELFEAAGDTARSLAHYKEFYRARTEVASETAAARMRRLRAQLELAEAHRAAERNRARAERLEHELTLARQVQLGLLPASAPEVRGVEIASVCLPAMQTGGDYYDFFPLDDGRLGIVVGDVTGKGLPAAIYMTLVKGILGAISSDDAAPSEVLLRANRLVCRMFPRGSFVTMVYAVLDPAASSLTYASAGHNPFLQLRSGRVIEHRVHGMALGLADDERFASTIRDTTIALERGDALLVYTDGLVEAMDADGQEFGLERLVDGFRRTMDSGTDLDGDGGGLDVVIARILAEIEAFARDGERHDDMTALAIRHFGA